MKNLCAFFLLMLALAGFSHAQLVPDEKNALLHIVVTDFSDKPLPKEILIFRGKQTKKEITATTNASGKCDVLIPKGDTYAINYLSFTDEKESSEIEVPNEEGLMEAKLTVQMEITKEESYELDVHFEPAQSTIRAESFPLLDKLVAQMKLKPTIRVELGGHTDSDGDDAANLKLSEARAAAVKAYLAKNGVAGERIATKGFGETRPVAGNDTAAGKARNRRTEVRVTQW